MYKAVIFDFDGTIADTLDTILAIFNDIAPQYGLPLIAHGEKEKIRNASARELKKEYNVTSWTLLRLFRDINTRLHGHMREIAAIEGMSDTVHALSKSGMHVGIVTSNSKENVETFLEDKNIRDVDFIHSEKNLFGKGAVLKNILKKKRWAPEEVIYVGDEVRDIEAADKAGMAAIAVTWGLNSKARLQQARPECIADIPADIVTYLNGRKS